MPDEVVDRGIAPPGEAGLQGRADPVDEAEIAAQAPEGRLGARRRARRRFGRGDDPGLAERPVGPRAPDGLLDGDAVVGREQVGEERPGTAVLPREDVAIDETRPEEVVVPDDRVLPVPVDRLPEPRCDSPKRYPGHRYRGVSSAGCYSTFRMRCESDRSPARPGAALF